LAKTLVYAAISCMDLVSSSVSLLILRIWEVLAYSVVNVYWLRKPKANYQWKEVLTALELQVNALLKTALEILENHLQT